MADFWTIIPVALVTSLITTIATMFIGERKLRRDYQLEYAAERVARQLMKDRYWRLRSFKTIKSHIGGFEDEELRQILVRSGAVRFWKKDDRTELWGLIERNTHRLGATELEVQLETRQLENRP